MDVYVFGYGSLVWKPEADFISVGDAYVTNYGRRFWNESPDHRGTELDPGRVVTILPLDVVYTLEKKPKCVVGAIDPKIDGKVYGRVFKISSNVRDKVLADLDHREKAGYSKTTVSATLLRDASTVECLLFSANSTNPHFVGPPSSVDELARHIARSVGPSGPNLEYFLRLYDAVSHLGSDEHLEALYSSLRDQGLVPNSESEHEAE